MEFSHQYYILVGHFGSGKTELALALARHMGSGTALVDLDIVNPYFRSSEHRDMLIEEGIDVIMPSFAHTTVDVPALSANVQSVFDSDRYRHVIIDVGGDPAGATALGRYRPLIQPLRERMQVLFVVNPMRPLTAKEEDIAQLIRHIEARARIQIDMLVNNANLQRQTSVRQLIDAQELLKRVSANISVPVGMVAGYERLRDELPEDMQKMFFPIDPIMLPEWLEDDQA